MSVLPRFLLVTLGCVAPGSVFAQGPTVDFITIDQDPEADFANAAAYSGDGLLLVIAHADTENVTVLDGAMRSHLATIPTGWRPVYLAVNADGTLAFTANTDHTVSMIDLVTGTLSAVVPITGTQAVFGMELTSDGAFVIVNLWDRISVVEVASASEVQNFPITGGPEMVLAPDDITLLTFGANDLSVYDVQTGLLLLNHDWGWSVEAMDISADGQLALAAFQRGFAFLDMTTLTPGAFHMTTVVSSSYLFDVFLTPDKTTGLRHGPVGTEVIDVATETVTATRTDLGCGRLMVPSFDGQYLVSYAVPGRANGNSSSVTQVVGLVPGLPVLAEVDCVSPVQAAAVHPGKHEFVALNNLDDRIFVIDADGASSHLVETASTGAPPEGDRPWAVTTVPDGSVAITANHGSDNLSFIDLSTRTVLGEADVGEGPADVAVTPDGSTAIVVCQMSHTISVVDVATRTELVSLPAPGSPAQVLVSDDGARAFVLTASAGDDFVVFVDLAGASSTVAASVSVPDVGELEDRFSSGAERRSRYGRLALSGDGSTLAVAARNADSVVFLDAIGMTVVQAVPVGAGPADVAFHPTEDRAFVVSPAGDTLTELLRTGGTWAVGQVLDYDAPSSIVVDELGEYAYVQLVKRVKAVDLGTMTKAGGANPLGQQIRLMAIVGPELFVLADPVTSFFRLHRIRMSAGSLDIVETITLGARIEALAVAPAASRAVVAWSTDNPSGTPDGIELIEFGSATSYCGPAIPNSSGQPAIIEASGTFLADGHPLRLDAHQLPPNQFGYFLASQTPGLVIPPGSQGQLCLGGQIGRFVAQIQFTGPAGEFGIDVDTGAIPTSPPAKVQAGETWRFQAWFRDVNPTQTSNFTDGVAVMFG